MTVRHYLLFAPSPHKSFPFYDFFLRYIRKPDLHFCVFVFVSIKLPDGTTLVSSDVSVDVENISASGANGTFSGNFFDLQDITQTASFSVTDGRFNANF